MVLKIVWGSCLAAILGGITLYIYWKYRTLKWQTEQLEKKVVECYQKVILDPHSKVIRKRARRKRRQLRGSRRLFKSLESKKVAEKPEMVVGLEKTVVGGLEKTVVPEEGGLERAVGLERAEEEPVKLSKFEETSQQKTVDLSDMLH